VAGANESTMRPAVRRSAPLLALALVLCLWLPGAGYGEDPAAQAGGTPGPTQSAADDMMSAGAGWLSDAGSALINGLQPIFAAVPGLPDQARQVVDRIAEASGGSFATWLLRLLAALAVGLAALRLAPLPLAPWRRAQLRLASDSLSFPALFPLFACDLVGVFALLVVAYAAQALWFASDSLPSRVALPFISALVYWRLILLPVDLVLRPREARARLIEVGDVTARRLREAGIAIVGLELFSTALLRVLFRGGMQPPDVRFVGLCLGVVNAGLAVYFIQRVRRAAAAGGEASVGSDRGAPVFFDRMGYPLALLFVLLALLAWSLGVTLKNLKPFWGLIDTAGILIGVWVLDMMVGAWLDHLAAVSKDSEGSERRAQWHAVVRHCVNVALWLGAATYLVELWVVDLARIFPSERWASYRGSIWSAAATIYIAYVLCRVVLMHTERHIRPSIQAVPSNEPAPIASRLQTVLPLMRVFILITIALLAALIALSNLGVNTTSLIAGASIFGLAISFGSQSLVRDIVSGIFFMADDAFRIGEYIDAGNLRGTVEGMSIRSLRLRHQNGQVHVVPFGQIQHVTNFSRDWTTVKFNLRLAHETDVEQVRKAVKQIGIEMMGDAELAAELIAPLKLQGVTDIDPNALVVRLKFTARPVQPTFVYRAALKRIHQVFREKGIGFSNPTVFVQARHAPGAPEEETAQLVSMAGAAKGQTSS
jgi:small-conductance mechanosensitive channel